MERRTTEYDAYSTVNGDDGTMFGEQWDDSLPQSTLDMYDQQRLVSAQERASLPSAHTKTDNRYRGPAELKVTQLPTAFYAATGVISGLLLACLVLLSIVVYKVFD